jgi:capsular exopolysaccharide synthesis family protein
MTENTSNRVEIYTELTPKFPSELSQCEIPLHIGPDSRLYSRQNGGALGAEQLRLLHVRLAELQIHQPFRRLLITSATRGEGKTHIAANLALTLAAEGQYKVLLIDTDVRNPSVHSTLGVPNVHGFKDWLLGGGDPWTAIRKIKRTALYVMTGGAAASESIGPTRVPYIRTLLDQVAPAFDLILLDSPPVLGTVDTKLLSTLADAVLMVVKAGSTPRHLVEQAQESLKGQNILGVVLNRIDPKHSYFASYYDHISGGPEPRVNGEVKLDISSAETRNPRP